MKAQTRHMTAQLIGLDLDLKPEVKEKLLEEQEKYDKAATHWVISENCLWWESEAASIAAGIMILANEVRGVIVVVTIGWPVRKAMFR